MLSCFLTFFHIAVMYCAWDQDFGTAGHTNTFRPTETQPTYKVGLFSASGTQFDNAGTIKLDGTNIYAYNDGRYGSVKTMTSYTPQGVKRWSVKPPHHAAASAFAPTWAVDGDKGVIFFRTGHYLVGYSTVSGKQLWTYISKNTTDYTSLGLTLYDGAVFLFDGVSYQTVSYNGSRRALYPIAEQLGEYTQVYSPVTNGKYWATFVASGFRSNVTLLDLQTGHLLWTAQTEYGPIKMMMDDKGNVYPWMGLEGQAAYYEVGKLSVKDGQSEWKITNIDCDGGGCCMDNQHSLLYGWKQPRRGSFTGTLAAWSTVTGNLSHTFKITKHDYSEGRNLILDSANGILFVTNGSHVYTVNNPHLASGTVTTIGVFDSSIYVALELQAADNLGQIYFNGIYNGNPFVAILSSNGGNLAPYPLMVPQVTARGVGICHPLLANLSTGAALPNGHYSPLYHSGSSYKEAPFETYTTTTNSEACILAKLPPGLSTTVKLQGMAVMGDHGAKYLSSSRAVTTPSGIPATEACDATWYLTSQSLAPKEDSAAHFAIPPPSGSGGTYPGDSKARVFVVSKTLCALDPTKNTSTSIRINFGAQSGTVHFNAKIRFAVDTTGNGVFDQHWDYPSSGGEGKQISGTYNDHPFGGTLDTTAVTFVVSLPTTKIIYGMKAAVWLTKVSGGTAVVWIGNPRSLCRGRGWICNVGGASELVLPFFDPPYPKCNC